MKTRELLIAASLVFTPCVSEADSPPSQDEIDFATEVKDTLVQRLFALLLNEFENTTPENFEAGNEAISLVFDDTHRNFRLVGDLDPLRDNDRPQDAWEEAALEEAKVGTGVGPQTLKVNGKYYIRESIPLSNFHSSCAICHQNFGSVDNQHWVGALMLRVPVVPGTKTK